MRKHPYTILVCRKRYPVSKEIYQAYHQHRESERYLDNIAADQERSLERFAQEGVSAEYRYIMSQPSLEDIVIHNHQLEELRRCISQLNDDEKALIQALFYQGISEKNFAMQYCTTQQTVSRRKIAVCIKLRKLLENF